MVAECGISLEPIDINSYVTRETFNDGKYHYNYYNDESWKGWFNGKNSHPSSRKPEFDYIQIIALHPKIQRCLTNTDETNEASNLINLNEINDQALKDLLNEHAWKKYQGAPDMTQEVYHTSNWVDDFLITTLIEKDFFDLDMYENTLSFYREIGAMFCLNFSERDSFKTKIDRLFGFSNNSSIATYLIFTPCYIALTVTIEPILFFIPILSRCTLLLIKISLSPVLILYHLLYACLKRDSQLLRTNLTHDALTIAKDCVTVVGLVLSIIALQLAMTVGVALQCTGLVIRAMSDGLHSLVRQGNLRKWQRVSQQQPEFLNLPSEASTVFMDQNKISQPVEAYVKSFGAYKGLFSSQSRSSKALIQKLQNPVTSLEIKQTAIATYLSEQNNKGKRLWFCLKMASITPGETSAAPTPPAA